jgi:polysaccharide export outer membrane protein
MKPNSFYSFVNTMLLVCLVFAASSFGQATDSKPANGNSGDGNKIAQIQKTPDTTAKNADIKPNEQRYRIGYQDTIEVTVFKHPELSGNYSINPDGTIFLPKLNAPVVAVCKTDLELKEEITAAYKKEYLKNPFVNVRTVDQKSQAFGIIGAVKAPGNYYINRRIHLLELLTIAGGTNLELAGTQLIVARTGGSSFCQEKSVAINDEDNPEIELLHFKIKDVQTGQQVLWMKPGDIVSVLEADPFYVMGNVNKPGMFYLKGPVTLTQAIATAEGFKPASKKDSIRILRQKPGSTEREDLVFKLKDIENKKIQDPLLQANDIVAVSEDRMKSIINGVTKSFTNGLTNIPFILP